MMKKGKYVLSLDEGTTSARAIIFDYSGNIVALGRSGFEQYYPNPGWVEHDPREILNAQRRAIKEAVKRSEIEIDQIESIGITNQRETVVIWDKKSGNPLHNAIVWQDRRTSDYVDELNSEYGDLIKFKTGLIPDSYFSGPKIRWLIENEEKIEGKVESGEALCGTIDSYLIYRLTGGEVHVSDYSNASRTMLFDIRELKWDEDLLDIQGVPEDILPEPRESSEVYGYTDDDILGAEIPISSSVGDQQAALFGQACYEPGMVKNTCGTGSFILMNTGEKLQESENLLTTVAWGLDGKIEYALEGSVFIAGAGVDWLKNSLEIIDQPSDVEPLARSIASNQGVYLVPAFVGLGAPYWDQYARGIITGITRDTGRGHLARASLEAIGYFTRDVLEEMEREGTPVEEIRVDGGVAQNEFLMQFLADITDGRVLRPKVLETTAQGAAYLSGLAVDFWDNQREVAELWRKDSEYEPVMDDDKRESLYGGWKKAVEKSLGWRKELESVGLDWEEI